MAAAAGRLPFKALGERATFDDVAEKSCLKYAPYPEKVPAFVSASASRLHRSAFPALNVRVSAYAASAFSLPCLVVRGLSILRLAFGLIG
jgi:hypothetical protein